MIDRITGGIKEANYIFLLLLMASLLKGEKHNFVAQTTGTREMWFFIQFITSRLGKYRSTYN